MSCLVPLGSEIQEFIMVNFAFGIILLMAQLSATAGGQLPDVLSADYSSDSLVAGQTGEVVVSLNVMDGYKINHTPPMTLKLEAIPGLALAQTSIVSPALDPDSTDVYYVDVPDFKVGVSAARAGGYEVPGELVYFFCSTADGFCARHTLDVMVPVIAE
jgi:hypothetical protein